MLKQFDVVQIITTKRIRFLSGPQGHATNPHGNWSVVGFMGSDVIIAKDKTIAKVPVEDLRPVAKYNIDTVLKHVFDAGYLKQDKNINMADHISKVLGVDIAKAKELLLSYNYRTTANSEQERDQITQRIAEIWQRRH